MIEFGELRRLAVFDGVCDASLRRAVAHAADVRIDEGQWLVREGEAPAFYVLLSGAYDLMKRYGDELRRPGRARGARRAPRRAADRARHAILRRRAGDQAAARGAVRPAAVRGRPLRESAPLRERIVAAIQNRIEGLESAAASTRRVPVVIGRSHDPDCHGLRDFLSRNQVPFEWADPDEPWIAART